MAERLEQERMNMEKEDLYEKSKDSKGRWRNRTVAFRVSQREWEMIDGMVSLSGLQKQDYILRKLMDWEVTIQGSSRIYKALKVQMDKIYQELKRLETGERPDEDLLTTLQMVALTLNGMKEESQHAEIRKCF